MRPRNVGAVASLAAAATVIVLSLGAVSSAGRTAPASCAKNTYNLQAYTYYVQRGSRWKVYRYTWRISGGGNTTTHSNLKLALKSNGSNAYSYNTKDNLVNDNRLYKRTNTTFVQRSKFTPTTYEVTFDRSRKSDVSCTASTDDI